MKIPRCTCHGEKKIWNKDPRYTGGGYFKCRVGARSAVAKSRAKAKP